jgi:hypothetical protein
MNVKLSFPSCFDENGLLDAAKLISYRKQKREESETEQSDEKSERKCRPFKKRMDYDYDPNDALNSEWYRRYISELKSRKSRKHFQKFRRRFRMPHHIFVSLVARARAECWFPTREKCNARGQAGIPLDILVLGSLRYLGSFCTEIQLLYFSTSFFNPSRIAFFNLFV